MRRTPPLAAAALEEYRGFFLDGGPGGATPRHRRLSVSRKELLVECSEMEGIASSTMRLPPDPDGNFADQGNDPNAFAQAYSLATAMKRISDFFAKEGAPTGNNPQHLPGAALDMWWVRDKLNDMGYVVYENGAMGATHKYSGPYKDLQRPNDATRDRDGWLSIASDEILKRDNPTKYEEIYGGGQGVAILSSYNNRNTECRHFIKLTWQGRKGFRAADGKFYTGVNQAAREQDERHEPTRPTYQGSVIFVNSLSEEQGIVDQAEFTDLLEYSSAHEMAHLFVGNDNNHFEGNGNVLSKNRGTGLSNSSFTHDEIINIKLRQRASISRDSNR